MLFMALTILGNVGHFICVVIIWKHSVCLLCGSPLDPHKTMNTFICFDGVQSNTLEAEAMLFFCL